MTDYNPYFFIVEYFIEHLFEEITLENFKEHLEDNSKSNHDLLNNFISKGYIKVLDGIAYLNFLDPFIYSIKKSRDLFLISNLSPVIREEVHLIHNDIMKAHGQSLLSAILIGSTARATRKKSSDIDIVIISRKDIQITKQYAKPVQVIRYCPKKFEQAFRDRNDIALWTIKYGLVLSDRDILPMYLTSKKVFIAKNSLHHKRLYIENLIDRTHRSFAKESENTYRSNLIALSSQIARYIILLHNKIPKSKSELPEQLNEFSPILAKTINELTTNRNMCKQRQLALMYNLVAQFYNSME